MDCCLLGRAQRRAFLGSSSIRAMNCSTYLSSQVVFAVAIPLSLGEEGMQVCLDSAPSHTLTTQRLPGQIIVFPTSRHTRTVMQCMHQSRIGKILQAHCSCNHCQPLSSQCRAHYFCRYRKVYPLQIVWQRRSGLDDAQAPECGIWQFRRLRFGDVVEVFEGGEKCGQCGSEEYKHKGST